MEEIIKEIGAIVVPIVLYVLAGYYASNAQWCSRKIIIAVIVGLGAGLYALAQGTIVTTSWLDLAFNSGPALGAMYLADRVVKGIAKRFSIEWLYSDAPIEGGGE